MERNQSKERENQHDQRMKYKLELRRKKIDAILSKKRIKSPSNQNQLCLQIEEEKEDKEENELRKEKKDKKENGIKDENKMQIIESMIKIYKKKNN